MYQRFLKFNLVLSPLYILMIAAMLLAVLLGADDAGYIAELLVLTLQAWLLILLPNLIYFFLKRKEPGAFRGFIKTLFCIPIPFLAVALFAELLLLLNVLPM